jgi:uncharacterized protein YkwD
VTDEENPADGVPDGKSGTATASPKSGRIEAATEAPKNAAFQVGKALTVEEQQKREVGTTQLSEAHEASPDDIIREAFNADGMTEDVEELEANFFPPGTWEDHQEPQTESLALTDLKAATSQQKQDFLDMHNMYRCMHGVPPVTWSNAVADNAQKYVHGMTRMKHAQSYKITPPAGPAGENLAMGSAGMSAKRATEMWYAEVSNCGPFPGCKDGSRGVTGHFTPIVWKGVKEIGCGFSADGRFVICRYKAGDRLSSATPNMGGAYKSNVFKASKSEAQCKGASGGSGGGGNPTPSTSPPKRAQATPPPKGDS